MDIPLFPEQASSIAALSDGFIVILIAISAFFSVLVAGLIVFFSIRYSAENKDVDRSNPVDENSYLEIGWSIVPLIVALTVFVWSAQVYFEMYTPPQDTLNISVIGKQWMWKAQHPDGRREVNELHVPIGQPVKLTMTSQDVIHSYFIPAFRIKQDVVPGRYTTMWFEATQTGEYHLFCAEFCGAEHSKMIGTVYVMEPADYEAWLREGGVAVGTGGGAGTSDDDGPPGASLFAAQGCETCHKLDGSVGIGPNLVGIYNTERALDSGETVIADEEYLRESIIDPQAKLVAGYDPVMPTYQGQMSEEELLQLVEYLVTLESNESASLSQ